MGIYLTKRIGVVTVTFNSEDVIRDFLESLCANLSGIELILYVVDNNSKDETMRIISDYSDRIEIRIQENAENRGVAAGWVPG
ncbi:glycosyltransferase family 2 protein [Arthrobacter sp. MMS18-M83]|uniref:glycosyltransferase family 2 protein n=1 Tax=Arthrobacter sp. MMS18-M83 TaxID=2996261 RepID=UPI00227AD644|nr:glycosyltransferase [Arthrobacter sp. MMS18-M83]WAH95906.1 glycosyltransferase [Arthrobacter sp. MMS18-M83]